jgi:hemoglobin-like flavoprotein
MALDIPTLRSSFELVVAREAQVMTRFYQLLFERYPQTKPLFGARNTPEVQAKMLTEALVAVVDHLEDAPWLTETLGVLGAKHVGYGVTDEMYGWVGECLLAAMAEVAAADWTPAIETAWTDAYGAIVSLALAGAVKARARATH